MTLATIALALTTAAAGGCVCTCVTTAAEFETACHERGGQVRSVATSQACVAADGGVVATWVVDDDGGADAP